MKQQLQDSSFLYQTGDIFPPHFQVYFGEVSMFWARWMLGNLCFQRAWLELWALMNKHLQACLEKPQRWPQTPHCCWHLPAWDQSQPWCEQDLCNLLEGRDSFILSKKREPAREGESPKHNCKAQPDLFGEQIFFPLGGSVWNKALPALPHLFARCGFPVFHSTNCVPAGAFYGWACTCSTTITDSLVPLERGEAQGSGRGALALGKWQELLPLTNHGASRALIPAKQML